MEQRDGEVPVIYRTCGLPVMTKLKHTVQLRLNGDTSIMNTQTTAAIMRRDAPQHQLPDGGNLYDPKGNKFVYDPNWSMDVFLAKASSFLGLILDATRAFSLDGDEITGCFEFAEGATIFVTLGEEFALEKSKHKNKVGHFTVGGLVGRDRLCCDVHEGKFDLTGECVALKFIPKKAMVNGLIKDRLDTELACLTKLNHTNIQNLLEIVDKPQHIVRLYDYSSTMTGGNIRHYLREQREGFALVWEQAQVVLLQIISAVTHLHINGVIHKDLTLDNIGLVTKGSLHHVKLTGFYICEIVQSPDQDLIAPSAGTLSYLPPEVFSKPGNENESLHVKGSPLDIWALGVIAFALLSGRKPFSGPDLDCEHNYPPHEIQANIVAGINKCTWEPRVSDTAKRIIKRLLARNPAKRPDVRQLYALVNGRVDGEDNGNDDAEDDNAEIPVDQNSEHWILGQTYTTQLKDESHEAPAIGRRHPSITSRPQSGQDLRISPPPQTLLPEVPQLLVQEKKVSGAVIEAFDAHIQSINDKLLTKLDAVERLTQETKKMDRIALKATQRKSGSQSGKAESLVPLSEPDADLLEMAEKTAPRQKFRGRRISDMTGYLSNSQLNSADASLSGSTHGLSTAAELLEEAKKEVATVSTSTVPSTSSTYGSTSTPTEHKQTGLRSMSINDVDISGLGPGPGPGPHSARKSEDGSMNDSIESSTGASAAAGTKAAITVPTLTIGTITTTSSASPPLPMLIVPAGGGGGVPPIRRNSSSSKDLAALVPIDTTFTSNRASPGIAAMIAASAATRLTYDEMSRPPENEDEIDYGKSQGFKPIKTAQRRGSKTLLDAQGGLPTIIKPSTSNKR